jgi:hypothetical protein
MSESTNACAYGHGPNILRCGLDPQRSRYGNLRARYLLITLVVTLVWSTQRSFGTQPDWYECPVGQIKHLDLNKISLIRDSVIGPNLHTLRFYSFGSHFLLGVSASGFSDQMLAQLESLVLPKSNWVRVLDKDLAVLVNLDYVVGYSPSPGGGYILVLTTGEKVVATAQDDAARAKIKEFGFH